MYRHVKRPRYNDNWFNPNVELPYGVEPKEVETAIKEFYEFYADMNQFFLEEGHGRLDKDGCSPLPGDRRLPRAIAGK